MSEEPAVTPMFGGLSEEPRQSERAHVSHIQSNEQSLESFGSKVSSDVAKVKFMVGEYLWLILYKL